MKSRGHSFRLPLFALVLALLVGFGLFVKNPGKTVQAQKGNGQRKVAPRRPCYSVPNPKFKSYSAAEPQSPSQTSRGDAARAREIASSLRELGIQAEASGKTPALATRIESLEEELNATQLATSRRQSGGLLTPERNSGILAPLASGTEVEPNGTAATANAMPALNPVSIMTATISPANDVDYFSFTASAGDRVWALVDTGSPPTQAGTSRDSQLSLRSPGDVEIEFDDDDGQGSGCDGVNETGLSSAIAGRSLTASGTHFLRTNAFATTTTIDPMKVFLTVTNTSTPESESNNTAATANVITLPIQVRTASIGVAGDVDYYSVVCNAGDLLYVNADTDPEGNGSTDLVVQIRSPGDVLLATADSTFGTNPREAESMCFMTTVAGTHYVRVAHFSASGTGTYDIMIANANAGVVASPPSSQSWTSAGSAGALDEDSNAIAAVSNFVVGLAPGATGTVTMRYNITATRGFIFCPATQSAVNVRFRNSDNSGAHARVRFTIYRSSITGGGITPIFTFDSNGQGAGSAFTSKSFAPAIDFDFANNLYWIEATVFRDDPNQFTNLGAIQIYESAGTACP